MAGDRNERRKFPRYSYNIGVEVRQGNAKAGYWGNVDDISLGGCYINTFSPIVSGTDVILRFKLEELDILVAGRVATCHPGVGMGVQFSSFLSDDGANQLQILIANLERSGPPKD